jgi:hypothetical protein
MLTPAKYQKASLQPEGLKSAITSSVRRQVVLINRPRMRLLYRP